MASPALLGRSILIVEDEPIIAFDIASAFEEAGASVSIAATLVDAARLVEQVPLSAAVLDFGGDANPLCVRLRERGVPFILHSGYGFAAAACHGGIVIPKPADPATLIGAIAQSLKSRSP